MKMTEQRVQVLPRLVFLLLVSVSANAASHAASGTITQNGKTVSLKAAVAVWDKTEKELTIGLIPFAVTSQDVDEIRGSGTLFLVVEKPSPDPGIWQHPPFAELVIRFEPNTRLLSRESVIHYRLQVSWLDRMNHTSTLNRNSRAAVLREFGHLTGSLREGGSVQLSFAGSDSLMKDMIQWDVRVNSTIHPQK